MIPWSIFWSSLVISTSSAVVARLIALLLTFTESLKVFLFPLIPLCEEFFVPATTTLLTALSKVDGGKRKKPFTTVMGFN